MKTRFERVLVTGGSGRLGRFVVDELLERCKVRVLDLKPPRQKVDFNEASVLDAHGVARALSGQQAVLHLAAIDDGDGDSETAYLETNVLGTWHVLQAAEAAGVALVVLACSCGALGIDRERRPDYLPIDEAHPLRPTGGYGLSKHLIERMAGYFARRRRLRIVCLRPTLIVRPEKEAAFLAQLELADPDKDAPPGATGADRVRPYGALSTLRSYVRSADAARCFRLALDYEGRFDTFIVAAPDTIGRDVTVERLRRIWGGLPEIRDPARYRADPYASALDSRKAEAVLGWRADGDWRDVVAAHER